MRVTQHIGARENRFSVHSRFLPLIAYGECMSPWYEIILEKKWSYKCECRCANVYVYIMYICSLPACVFAVMYVGWTMSADLSDVLRVSCSYGSRSPGTGATRVDTTFYLCCQRVSEYWDSKNQTTLETRSDSRPIHCTKVITTKWIATENWDSY